MTHLPKEASDLFDSGFGTDEIVRRKIINAEGKPASSRTARRWRLEWKNKQVNKNTELFQETAEGAVINLDTSEVKTLDDLLFECGVDLSLWEVDKHEITKHEVPRKDTIKHLNFDAGKITGHLIDDGRMYVQVMYNIRVVLKRRKVQPFEAALDGLLQKIDPPSFSILLKKEGDYLFSPQMYDMHFNKLSSDGRYTIQQAADEFMQMGDALIARAKTIDMPIDRVMLPVGNDALHVDNLQSTTTRGTWVETAADQRDAIQSLCSAYVYVIEKLAEIGEVDVITVQGNHDRYSSYWLGMFLSGWFRNHAEVNVDTDRSPRKYYTYGKTLIGLEHGDNTKAQDLVALMATEAPRQWAETEYRIWMRGHLHGKDGMYHPITEKFGMTIMTIPALCPMDDWHLLRGYVGNHRAAEGMLFHRKFGLATTFPVFIEEIEQVINELSKPALAGR